LQKQYPVCAGAERYAPMCVFRRSSVVVVVVNDVTGSLQIICYYKVLIARHREQPDFLLATGVPSLVD